MFAGESAVMAANEASMEAPAKKLKKLGAATLSAPVAAVPSAIFAPLALGAAGGLAGDGAKPDGRRGDLRSGGAAARGKHAFAFSG